MSYKYAADSITPYSTSTSDEMLIDNALETLDRNDLVMT